MDKDVPACALDEALRLDALEKQQITDTPREESFERIVRLACAALEAPIGAITFLESERQWIKSARNFELDETTRRDSFCTHTIQRDEVMVVEDATKDARFRDNPFVTAENGVRFYAGAPLTTREGFRIGSLCVVDHIPRKINQRDRDLLKDMAAIVIDEMELRKRVGTDLLTGLYNRRFLDELGHREITRARREHRPLTAAFIDADRFKSINDTYGHPAGDAVLRGLGPAIAKALRGTDLLARYGGEELVLLLPGTTLEQAEPVLERLRLEIAAMQVPELKGRQVTASIGAAELRAADADMAALLARADAALYRAKESGRNRVALAA